MSSKAPLGNEVCTAINMFLYRHQTINRAVGKKDGVTSYLIKSIFRDLSTQAAILMFEKI